MRASRRAALLVWAVLVCVAAPLRAQTPELYGVSRWVEPWLIRIDPATGAGTPLVPIASTRLTDIDVAPDGTLYGAHSGQLFAIDRGTGDVSVRGLLGSTVLEGDLAFHPQTGALYGIDSFEQKLYTINTATGAATLVGSLGTSRRDISALGFDGTGRLFAVHRVDSVGPPPDYQLATVDLATGLMTNVKSLGNIDPLVGEAGVAALDFDPFTNLGYFTTGSELYTLDPDTYAVGLVGPIGESRVSGLAFVPEPSACVVLAMVMTVVACVRRRRA